VSEGPLRRLGVFTGEGNDLDNDLRGERGGGTRAGFIGEDRLDQPQQLGLRGPFCRGGFEAVSRLDPTLSPDAGRLPVEVELTSDLLVRLAIGGEADDLEAT